MGKAIPVTYKEIIFLSIVLAGLYFTSLHSYLLFHSLVEIFSIGVAICIFMIAWNSRDKIDNNYLLFIGISFIFIAGIDLLHTLAFKGMGVFPGYDANLPTQLWIAARYLQSISLIVAPVFLYRKLKLNTVLFIYSLVFSLLIASIFFWKIFPDCFIEGKGLTPFKIISEYVISIFLGASIYFLYKSRKEIDDNVFSLLVASIIILIFSELAFTTYASVFGFSNMLGHLFKFVAFYLIYKGIIVTGLMKPYDLIFRDLKQSENELKQHRDRLSELVDKRTAELILTNRLLNETQHLAKVGGWEYDVAAAKSTWTEEVYRIYGVTPGDYDPDDINRNIEFFSEEDRSKTEYAFRLAVEEGEPYDLELKFRNARGEDMWIRTIGKAERKDGRIVRVYGNMMDITERKLAEEKVNQIAAIVQSSEDAIIGKTLDGIITSWNRGAEKIYGYFESEVIGRPVTTLVPQGFEKEVTRILDKIKSGEYVEHYEAVRRRKDGRIIHMSLTVSPVRDAKGRIVAASAIGRDITERRRAEEKLKEVSLYTRSLIEASLDPLVTISSDGKITDVNRATEEVTGVQRKLLIGSDFSNYFTEPEKAKEGYLQVFSKGFVRDYPLAIRHVSGRITDVLYNATLYKDVAGNVTGLFAAARDITERKRAEKEREQFFKFFQISSDIMVIADPNGSFRKVNPATLDVLGYPEIELISKPFVDFIHPDDKQSTLDEMARQIKIGSSLNFENRYICKDGTLKWLSWRARYDKDEGKTYATARDITESKRAEEELCKYRDHLEELVRERTALLTEEKNKLIKSQLALASIVEELNETTSKLEKANVHLKEIDRLKSVFISTMSHELRTPLNSIIGFTSIIMHGFSGPLNDEQRKQLDMVKKSADHLLSLINDILDISKIEAGQLKMVNAPFEMRKSIETVTRILTPLAEAKNLALHVEIEPGVGTIVSDQRRVEQILLNLLSNAIKFTEEGEIKVQCHIRGNSIITSVKDTGIGIKPENMDRLFKPFIQLEDGITRRHEGTGLGLSISKRLVEMLGGTISAESEFGNGSVFTFILPREAT